MSKTSKPPLVYRLAYGDDAARYQMADNTLKYLIDCDRNHIRVASISLDASLQILYKEGYASSLGSEVFPTIEGRVFAHRKGFKGEAWRSIKVGQYILALFRIALCLSAIAFAIII